MNIPSKEELDAKMQKDIRESKAAIFNLIQHNELVDEDDYPTDAALDIIQLWHWSDARGWFSFIESIWHLSSWGWQEGTQPDEFDSQKWVYLYNISTAGWSGNESIIHAMQKNTMLWHLNWVQSRRGGHYIFELRSFDDE